MTYFRRILRKPRKEIKVFEMSADILVFDKIKGNGKIVYGKQGTK